MVEPMPTPNPMMIAYHERSDHGRDGEELDGPLCNCRTLFVDYTIRIAAITIDQLGLELNNGVQQLVGEISDDPGDWMLGYVQGVLDTRDTLLHLAKDIS
jgi:hypothetical protein